VCAGCLLHFAAMQHRNWRLSASVVGFLLLGVLSLTYLFTRLGEAGLRRSWGYSVHADFANAGGLKPGTVVEIAGVTVGQVVAVNLMKNGRARVTLQVREDVPLQDDVIASIQTKGLLGERYILITPGGAEQALAPGSVIRDTESPIDLPGLLAAYVGLRRQDSPAQEDSQDRGVEPAALEE
jgi:phospholipid/cholesterol/gamma-HCH transport system substrate-binding protein